MPNENDSKKQNLQTITLEDTPSPAVSVITISDSSEEDEERMQSATTNSALLVNSSNSNIIHGRVLHQNSTKTAAAVSEW